MAVSHCNSPLSPPPAARLAIDLKDVTLTLNSRAGAVEILRGVDLSVAEGQSVALVGPSGSGKSSLLMVMTGLEAATSGQVLIAGHDFTKASEDRLAAIRGQSIGIVFQSFHLIPTMTAIENVALPLEFLGRGDAFERAAEALAERWAFRPAPPCAGPAFGRRAAARRAGAGAWRPAPILFADEPTGNLDGETGKQIIDLIFGLHRRMGTTLVLITHDTKLAARCERTVVINDGRIAGALQAAAYA